MELVAGSYEQVLFGFTVHPKPETSGNEVRFRERRESREGRGKVWYGSHTAEVNIPAPAVYIWFYWIS
jgi:hypothetical protein